VPNSFSQLYIHHVSAVKHRQGLILPEFEEELYKYIIGIIKKLDQFPIRVNGMPDHIHIAARLKPSIAPSEFVRKVKANSSKWINANSFLDSQFAWQKGGATFSISHTHLGALDTYIKNQKLHHSKVSFKKEYIGLLETNGLAPDSAYMPEFVGDC